MTWSHEVVLPWSFICHTAAQGHSSHTTADPRSADYGCVSALLSLLWLLCSPGAAETQHQQHTVGCMDGRFPLHSEVHPELEKQEVCFPPHVSLSSRESSFISTGFPAYPCSCSVDGAAKALQRKGAQSESHIRLRIKMAVSGKWEGGSSHLGTRIMSALNFTLPPLWSSSITSDT